MKLITRRGKPYEYYEPEKAIHLFSCSQVRRIAYDPFASLPESILEAARQRGKALHMRFAVALMAVEGLCDYPKVPEEYQGYCLAMDTWIQKHNVRPLKVEEPSRCLKLGVAGTPDAKVLYGPKRKITLADLKTGEEQPTDPMQLLCYEKFDGYTDSEQLLDLYVYEDGTYDEKFVKRSERVTQWCWFMAALGVLQSRVNHNVK